MLHKKLLSLLSFICIIQLTTAQSFERKADSIIQKVFNDPNGPGGTFLVSKKENRFIIKLLEKLILN